MKRKLYILCFTVEGLDQICEETDGDDVDPDEDNHEVNSEEQKGEEDRDDMGDGEDDEAIDEIDKANFQSKNLETLSNNKCVQVGAVSAADFHPHILLDEIPEDFVEDTREKVREEKVLYMDIDIGKELDVDMGSPICTTGMPMSVHLDYCCEQLRKFDMLESDEEEEVVMPEIQCLAKEISTTLGPTKRSLLDTLEKEAGQKKKINTTKDGENEVEQLDIISDMIYEEKVKGIQFANNNPEIVLLDNLDLGCGLGESSDRQNSSFTSDSIADVEMESLLSTHGMLEVATSFYKKLFSFELKQNMNLGASFWEEEELVTEEENDTL
ncbi:hypothetical protein D1007_48722 [Hordeum vulgare]|nr:hypothetical protein D1007_48722 [Hordeum vulgare]